MYNWIMKALTSTRSPSVIVPSITPWVARHKIKVTALAMIIGMLPLSLGLGEGGEQNAPLGRAVIGGLVLATFATLFFVPVIFGLLHRDPNADSLEAQIAAGAARAGGGTRGDGPVSDFAT